MFSEIVFLILISWTMEKTFLTLNIFLEETSYMFLVKLNCLFHVLRDEFYAGKAISLNILRVMLSSAFRALIKNQVKEIFYGKKKTINILTVFFISHKSDVKTFFNWILN